MNLPDLTENEKKVLYWKCKNQTHAQIGRRLGFGSDWVQLQASGIYAKLGWETKNVHWTATEKRLRDEVCPLVPKDLNAWLSEGNAETPPPAVPERHTRRNIIALGMAGAVILVCALLAGLIIRNLPVFPAPTRTIPANTPLPSATAQVFPTLPSATSQLFPTSQPTQPIPTDTLIPTNTAILPTFTPKPYFTEAEAVTFKPDVYMHLDSRFSSMGGPCYNANLEWGVRILINNNSREEFTLRYNSSSFSATDDIGTKYDLVGAGPYGSAQILGLDHTEQVGLSQQAEICVTFGNPIPLQANYLLITADWISGVGPVVFRKDI